MKFKNYHSRSLMLENLYYNIDTGILSYKDAPEDTRILGSHNKEVVLVAKRVCKWEGIRGKLNTYINNNDTKVFTGYTVIDSDSLREEIYAILKGSSNFYKVATPEKAQTSQYFRKLDEYSPYHKIPSNNELDEDISSETENKQLNFNRSIKVTQDFYSLIIHEYSALLFNWTPGEDPIVNISLSTLYNRFKKSFANNNRVVPLLCDYYMHHIHISSNIDIAFIKKFTHESLLISQSIQDDISKIFLQDIKIFLNNPAWMKNISKTQVIGEIEARYNDITNSDVHVCALNSLKYLMYLDILQTKNTLRPKHDVTHFHKNDVISNIQSMPKVLDRKPLYHHEFNSMPKANYDDLIEDAVERSYLGYIDMYASEQTAFLKILYPDSRSTHVTDLAQKVQEVYLGSELIKVNKLRWVPEDIISIFDFQSFAERFRKRASEKRTGDTPQDNIARDRIQQIPLNQFESLTTPIIKDAIASLLANSKYNNEPISTAQHSRTLTPLTLLRSSPSTYKRLKQALGIPEAGNLDLNVAGHLNDYLDSHHDYVSALKNIDSDTRILIVDDNINSGDIYKQLKNIPKNLHTRIDFFFLLNKKSYYTFAGDEGSIEDPLKQIFFKSEIASILSSTISFESARAWQTYFSNYDIETHGAASFKRFKDAVEYIRDTQIDPTKQNCAHVNSKFFKNN